MKRRLELSLKQFIPASLIFALVFLALRLYEIILLGDKIVDVNVISLELKVAADYKQVFSCLLYMAN